MQPDEHVPFQQEVSEAQPKPLHASWTALHDRLLVGRLLASPLELKPLMVRAWSFLRPHVVGKPAVAPRLWAT